MTFEKSVTSETLEAELTDIQARETSTQTATKIPTRQCHFQFHFQLAYIVILYCTCSN